MPGSTYALGFDFGTLSCRCVLIDLKNGKLKGSSESRYKSGVIEEALDDGNILLPFNWALQDPNDWIESMSEVCHKILQESKVKPEQILSIGTDFTNCTVVPCKANGTVLCQIDEYRKRPHAWPKLWKHHGAQQYAEEIQVAAKNNTTWLKKYFGNAVSSEWLFPKALQVLREDPDIYRETEIFIEAVDYIVLFLTGRVTRNTGLLGLNSFWSEEFGFPSDAFLKQLDPRMEHFVQEKMWGDMLEVGDCAGHLTKEAAAILGLTTETIVASGHGDSEVTACGVGASSSGSMILVMGTSTCHQMLSDQFLSFEGLCSVAKGGMIPGLYSYESGQPATGDTFAWLERLCQGGRYEEEAKKANRSLLAYLGELAEKIEPGASGLLALDWLAGNRCLLFDDRLSGAIIGLSLETKIEEIYRALVEGNIFGSKKIIDNYEANGLHIKQVFAVGGIAERAPWIIQMCADVIGKPVYVPTFEYVSARGAAICSAVALGKIDSKHGFLNFEDACIALIPKERREFVPDRKRMEEYEEIYQLYSCFHDTMAKPNFIMKRLKEIKERIRT